MQLYLDTAQVSDWSDLMPSGLFYGITTNPLLAHRAGLSYPDIDWAQMAARARDLGAAELHGQVFGPAETYQDWAGAFYQAGAQAGIETVVKIPLTAEGIRAAPTIRKLGGRILMTACYDAKQMITASLLGAAYIAPYYGRMIEKGIDAPRALRQMLAISRQVDSRCRVLVASLRSTDQMLDLAEQGHSLFTLAPNIARDLFSDPNTVAAVAEFEQAAVPKAPT